MQDSPSACPLVVGIDVGGTKTHLRALACDTPVAGRRRPPGWRTPVRRAVGGHACETPRQCERIRTALPLRFDAPALVVGDAHLLAPAAGLDKGTALVAGTGSVAVGRLPDGTAVQVGGWGAVLGDEGGAAGLVREAARAVWAAHDRGEEPDSLALGLSASLDVPEVPALAAALEGASVLSAEWGRHAPSPSRPPPAAPGRPGP